MVNMLTVTGDKEYKIHPKVEKHLRKNKKAWSRKGLVAILTYTIVVVLTSLFVKSMWDGYWRTHSWRFQSPVIFQNPLIIREIKPRAVHLVPKASKSASKVIVEAPVPLTEYDTVMKQPHGKVLWNIYMLESTRGKNDWCRVNGKGYGGFGVMGDNGIACYETFEKSAERAEYWLSKLNPDKSLASALCAYNLGVQNLTSCDYYQSYLSL